MRVETARSKPCIHKSGRILFFYDFFHKEGSIQHGKTRTEANGLRTRSGRTARLRGAGFPIIPMQGDNPTRFSRTEALKTGTLFPGLDLPFKAAIQARTQLPNTALVELMALDFAVKELNLYLDTHSGDQEALDLYVSYIKMAREGRAKYIAQYGPLNSDDLTPEGGYAWLNDPWPWELGGND